MRTVIARRTWLSALLAAAALITAVSTAPARQTPPTLPRPPGQAEPSATPGTPAPLVAPSIPVAPTPDASASASTLPSPQSSPSVSAPGTPAPPAAAAASPVAALIRFTGELLDVRNGFVYFVTSDAFKAGPAMRVTNLDPGTPALLPAPRIFARATLDPANGSIVELALTRRKLPTDAAYQQAYAQVHTFVVAGSPRIPAPELRGQHLTGRPVTVEFYVQVPPTTPLDDAVYITTDASGWVANAMKMDRIDALHYRLARSYASGTKFAYRFTRGTWTSVEVGEDGLQDDPHVFSVPEVDVKRLSDVVYRWSDQNPTQPQAGPDSIPTPFNPNPFGNLPTGNAHPGIPQASPTPRP